MMTRSFCRPHARDELMSHPYYHGVPSVRRRKPVNECRLNRLVLVGLLLSSTACVSRKQLVLDEVVQGHLVYRPGRREAWLAIVTLIVLALLKLTGAL